MKCEPKELTKIWKSKKGTIIDESHVKSNKNWLNITEKSVKEYRCRITEFTQNEMEKSDQIDEIIEKIINTLITKDIRHIHIGMPGEEH